MHADADAEAAAPLREPGEKVTEGATALERALIAKRRELAAHASAIELHEQAAALQERLGQPDRAANTRQHAEHARELHERALEEQTAQEAGLLRGGGHRAR